MVKANSSSEMDIDGSQAGSSSPKTKKVDLEACVKTITLIEKGLDLNQPRHIQRAIRQSVAIRKYVKASQVGFVISNFYDRLLFCSLYGKSLSAGLQTIYLNVLLAHT